MLQCVCVVGCWGWRSWKEWKELSWNISFRIPQRKELANSDPLHLTDLYYELAFSSWLPNQAGASFIPKDSPLSSILPNAFSGARTTLPTPFHLLLCFLPSVGFSSSWSNDFFLIQYLFVPWDLANRHQRGDSNHDLLQFIEVPSRADLFLEHFGVIQSCLLDFVNRETSTMFLANY